MNAVNPGCIKTEIFQKGGLKKNKIIKTSGDSGRTEWRDIGAADGGGEQEPPAGPDWDGGGGGGHDCLSGQRWGQVHHGSDHWD